MKGVILAASYGTRLAPLTLKCPKAAVCVDNKPMLECTIESIIAPGVTEPKTSQQISEVVTNRTKSGISIWTCDISGAFWLDIDTSDDLEHVNYVLRRGNGQFES